MSRTLVVIWVLAGFCFAPSTFAQTGNVLDEPIVSGTSYRMFAYPGEPTVTVQLLGEVASGVYVVGSQTSLLELLTLAGGTVISDGGPNVRRTLTVRLLREEGSRRNVVYEADFNELLRSPGAYPTLRNGDVVTVDARIRERMSLLQGLQIITSISTVVLLVLRLVDGS